MAKILKLTILLLAAILTNLTPSQAQETQKADYKKIASKINELVEQNFYNTGIYKRDYKDAASNLIEESASVDNMQDMSSAANKALAALKTSHCQFVTDNDEIFYFLHSLFSATSGKPSPKTAVAGFVCGGAGFERDRVRYVLDGTTASRNGVRVGDRIVSVDDKTDWTYRDIVKNRERIIPVKIERNGKFRTLAIKPKREEVYLAYVEAMMQSIRYIARGGHTFGYIHVFTGGKISQEMLHHIILNQLFNTDGLILDLRDGYGASDLSDLDVFFRPIDSYPVMKSTGKDGRTRTVNYCYDKPLVVLINEGSRSGKEIIAYALQKSKRAVLMGTNTAGYVVAGRLFELDDHCALYLAVNDITLNGERLEGKGVAPDVVVKNEDHTYEGYQHQLDVAIATLEKQLSQKAADLR